MPAAFVKTEPACGAWCVGRRIELPSSVSARRPYIMWATDHSGLQRRTAFTSRQAQMTDETERIVQQSQDLIGALRREREDLLEQIRKSQATIAASQQLIKRLDEVLAKAENPKS
jgi:adenine-specific DNA methylase